ncbi:MAG: YIP1 family protein [Bacteroidota bacterium]|nr:YIP1 family protein [Bacteroidota bacterium]
MRTCSVCSSKNDEAAVVCWSCGSYLQERVPNLDLFPMIWKIIESPRAALHRALIAEHKNYVLFLNLFFGIAVSFALLWLRHAGNEFDNLIYLLLLGVVMGLVLAYPLGMGAVFGIHVLAKLFRGAGTMRNTYAVIGWSLTPILLSVIFVLPIELASMGLLFFTTNPSASEVKPAVFFSLASIDGMAVLWTMYLAALGVTIVHKIHFIPALLIVLSVAAVLFSGTYALFTLLAL